MHKFDFFFLLYSGSKIISKVDKAIRNKFYKSHIFKKACEGWICLKQPASFSVLCCRFHSKINVRLLLRSNTTTQQQIDFFYSAHEEIHTCALQYSILKMLYLKKYVLRLDLNLGKD